MPSTCKGDGGGCGPDTDDRTPEKIQERIKGATSEFIDAYALVFGSKPDQAIWNQIPDRLL
ncbi:hypothetical protein ccbrp13_71040 [Ktedonobacteria bacterium brp13]|nr:hypothetical protein ccbrp13_71040 [Ktedonobacteria bacterium brp13]